MTDIEAGAQENGASLAIDTEQLDPDALFVVKRLREAGHEAYLVGGCVRDLLLGRAPKDFDVATSATPQQIKRQFRNCRLIGRRFRLAHIFFRGGKIIEVSTFRATPILTEEAPLSEPEGAAWTEDREDVVEAFADHGAGADGEEAEDGDEGGEDGEEDDGGGGEADGEVSDDDAPGDDGEGGEEAELEEDEGEGIDEAVGNGTEGVATAPSEDAVAPMRPQPVRELIRVSAETLLRRASDASSARTARPRDLLMLEDNTFGTAREDALRRDFTINGLFYDPVEGVVLDYVKGLADLRRSEIRTIGDPELRMREDPVRMLRAARFAAKLSFDIDSGTYAAMEACVEDLPRCSRPRLLEETLRLVRGGTAMPALKLVYALGALETLLPPVNAFLQSKGHLEVDRYWRFLGAVDARVLRGEAFDDSMLVAALLLPVALAEPEQRSGDGAISLAHSIDALLQNLVTQAKLPRRIAERCRTLVLSQRTLSGQRRRRGGLMTFRAHPSFKEALRVFEVWVEATGEFTEALAMWQSGRAPPVAPDATGGRRRRRRPRGNKAAGIQGE